MRVEVLGFPVDAVDTAAALDLVADAPGPLMIVTLNAEMTMQGLAEPGLGQILRASGLVIPDGSGIVWAMRRQGVQVAKLPGVEFAEAIAAWCARHERRLYLLGAGQGVASEAARILTGRYPGLVIAGVRDGFFTAEDEPAVLREIRAADPDVLLVAMGVPRQEHWIARHQAALGVRVAMGVGGTFDVLAGRVQRAPGLYRRYHMEWLYRLIKQPWRWKRMMSTLPSFMWRVWRGKVGAS